MDTLKVENLPKDALFSMAVSMELPELLNFCGTNSRIYEICAKNDIWLYKLNKEFPNQYTGVFSPKDAYIILYKWKQTGKNLGSPADRMYGFNAPVFLKQPLIDFISNANFGETQSGTPIRDIIAPLVKNRVLTRSMLTYLFTLYIKSNNLKQGKYISAGPDIKKYLGDYLEELEAAGLAKTDGELIGRRGIKPRFNREHFFYSRILSIYNLGIYKENELDETQKKLLTNPTIQKASLLIREKLDKILNR